MKIRVYRAEPADFEAAYSLVQEYYQAASVVLREDAKQFAEEYFAEGAGVWLAEAQDGIVGCVALRLLKNDSRFAEIKRMYVRPAFRGQGIADLLLEALESYAKQHAYHWLYLDTAADMLAAARFYQRKGFLPCERYNDNPQAAIFMRKAITEQC